MEGVTDIKNINHWLEEAGLEDSTEALIMAGEEQALTTRSIQAGVYTTLPHIDAGCAAMPWSSPAHNRRPYDACTYLIRGMLQPSWHHVKN